MSTQYLDRRFMTLQEYIDRAARNPLTAADSTPRYAHPIDEWILRSLNATPAKLLIDKAIDTLISMYYGPMLATGVHIDQKSFPDIYEVLVHSSDTLGIPVPHALALNAGGDFNAFTAGTDEYSFIVVFSTLCKFFPVEEAWFVVGHECGHIASGHMVYHTLVNFLASMALSRMPGFGYLAFMLRMTIGLALDAWSRRSEVTADRAGLLCCGDIKVAERALLRLITGMAEVDRVDVDDYLRRSKEVEEYHSAGRFWEMMYSHPVIRKRIEALRLFARSELYYELSSKPIPAGAQLLTHAELDRQTNQIVRP
jgi:Zn-dependent protease with chaperone function